MPTIIVNHASKYYYVGRKGLFRRGHLEIGIEDANFVVKQGEFIFIIGSSGSGKSSLMKMLAGQIKPDKGSVLVDGVNISASNAHQRRLPLLIGTVNQYHTLNHRLTVEENLKLAAKVGRRKFKDQDDYAARIHKVLGLTGLPGIEKKYPGELTAGERRRVGLARALINSPPILVLDEMTANLDKDSMWDVFLLLNELNQKGTTIIMTTRNSDYVNMLRRRVITLVDGRIYSDEVKGKYGKPAKKSV